MVRERGEFHMKTEPERQLEQRVRERKQELMEEYRAQREQRKESKASQPPGEAKPHTRGEGQEEHTPSLDGARNGLEAGAGPSQVHSSRLDAHRQPAPRDEREVRSSPGPRLKPGNAVRSISGYS